MTAKDNTDDGDLLLSVQEWGPLIERLSALPEVSRYDSGDRNEAETIVHALSDLEEEFARFNKEMLPRVVNETDSEQLLDALEDIREQARHILYHLRDPHFFDVIWPVERPVR